MEQFNPLLPTPEPSASWTRKVGEVVDWLTRFLKGMKREGLSFVFENDVHGPIYDNGGRVFNVKHRRFGAKGDGVTDDTAATTAAIAAATASGGTVYFPPGTYRLNDIQVTSASNLTLDLGLATIKIRDGLTKGTPGSLARGFLFTTCTNLTIRGGTIDGNRNNVDVSGVGDGTAFGLQFSVCTDVTVEDVRAINCATDGIYIGSPGAGSWSTNVKLRGVLCHNGRRDGCSITAVKGASLVGCTFSGSNGTAPQAGLNLEPNAGQVVEDVKVVGCHFLDNTTDGVLFAGPTRAELVDCTFAGNLSHGVASNATATDCAMKGGTILMPAAAATGIYAYGTGFHAEGVRIVCSAVTQHGINFDSAGGYRCTARGCYISGVFQYGIYLKGNNTYAGRGEFLVEGNKVIGDATCTRGIYLLQSVGRCQILGNEVASVPVGIATANADQAIISGNTVRLAVTAGMLLETSNYLVVSGNTLDGTTTGPGLHMKGSYSTVTGNVSRGNGQHGYLFTGASDNAVTGNSASENSQQTDNTYDGFNFTTGCDRNVFVGNTSRRGALANKQKQGLIIATSDCDQNVVGVNDLYDGGSTTYCRDLGTNTLFSFAAGSTADAGNAAYTHTPWTNPAQVSFNTALTANRDATFAVTQAVKGMWGRVTRTTAATGAFSVLVKDGGGATLATLGIGQWCEVEFNGTAWALTELGGLTALAAAPTGAAGTVLRGAGVGTQPAYSTFTIPDTLASGAMWYASSTNVAAALAAPGAASVLTHNATIPAWAAALAKANQHAQTAYLDGSPVFSTTPTVPSIIINTAAGVNRDIFYQSSGSNRWILRVTSAAESGGNAGSNLDLLARDDSGGSIGTAIGINRATMAVTLAGALNVTGVVTLSNNLQHNGSNVGFYGVAAVARPAAFTQTYSTSSTTHANPTATTLTAASGTADGTVADVGASFNQTTLNNNFKDVATAINALIVDEANTKQVLNKVIDYLQANGLFQ